MLSGRNNTLKRCIEKTLINKSNKKKEQGDFLEKYTRNDINSVK